MDRILTPFEDKFKVVDIDDFEHINRIQNLVCKYKVRFVLVDSYRGSHGGDENNSKISKGLQALGGICEETNVACMVIHHTGKMMIGEDMTINCGRGSNAFLAAVRSQIVIDIPDPTPNLKEAWRRVQVLGENLGIAPKPVGFRFTEDGLEFGEAPQRPKKAEKESSTDLAVAWLSAVRMEPGKWYKAKDIISEAADMGFSATGSLQRAREQIGVITRKVKEGWEWQLPGQEITISAVNP